MTGRPSLPRLPLSRVSLLLLGLVVGAPTAAWSQEPSTRPTRTDVAIALMRFEQALERAALVPAERAEVNRAFDRATLAFFAGDRVGTLRQVDALTLRLLGLSEDPAARAALRLRLRLDPPGPRAEGEPTLRIEPLYPLDPLGDGPVPNRTARLLLQDASGRGATPIELTTEALTGPSLSVALRPLPEGLHHLRLVLPGIEGAPLPAASYASGAPDLDAARAALSARLEALPPTEDPAQVRARAGAAARLGLLGARPDEEDTAQSLQDPLALLGELEQELEALAAGRDPYHRRPGEQWRAFRLEPAGGRAAQWVRYRVQAPPAALEAGARLPVLIAFHGYQGDENMFRFAYGRGALFRLAAEAGLLLVTPRTEPFLRAPAALERLLDELACDYPLDRGRVWLLGHSMGAQAAALLARQRPERLAGVVVFAGGPMGGDVPTRAFVGELDIAGGLVRRGGAVEVLEGYGHTLGVGPHLPQALEWLRGLPPRKVWY